MTPTSPASTGLNALALAQAEQFAQLHELFAPQLRPLVSAPALESAWNAELGRQGPVLSIGTPLSEPAGAGTMVVRIPVTFERGQLTALVSVDSQGWVTGIQLAPPGAAEPTESWRPPDYADPGRFDEQDVSVGSGPLAVPGTLSVPHGAGPWPAVVLLAGSGPQDRDETVGRNKIFKDLAWGLASRGIAVLRFDKVTLAHREQVVGARDFTMTDEYVPHAVAAVQLLRQHPGVDPARVFVLGHSEGGTVAPRVAEAEPSVAGLIILAGGIQPLHRAAVRQMRYLASLDPSAAAAAAPMLEAITRQAETVDAPGLSSSTPASELPFGVPAAYWLDLRDYDPAATAAGLGKPILLLQGGRDYQVTVTDDLARWQAGLAHRTDVSVRVYDGDNHLFFAGTGPSTPAEYEPAQHLDPSVVGDIADWLANRHP